jgi:thiosulfate/3-mercaptopyruvate sulfurtransferase
VDDVTRDELAARLGDERLVLLDVRTAAEFEGVARAPCDPRHGHIAGALNVPLDRLLDCRTPEQVQALVGAPPGAEVVAYCHTGSRSAVAVEMLRAAGYAARNYAGSWHEWSRDPALPGGPRAG